ncbi:hypothetical protein I6A84_15380 [Frankia sp. CNm7]|uniref:FTP domain-containing protein n=1 Tax=Frankia nepalensis TaxID=1836974 RepID=A0A937RN13_9ACTN|nr:hypothetical protein [Frankia nepalensis]MBL7497408.1 hypothetical protein [Frankia nepalensis]MBL7512111.1 hypothetical protein [Frankia nepalensis]MBL7519446.1 hypothetical protein [Frankia nepalensis]MBL7631789.1 hypothetical protein [Frankia nepalensis]
MAGSRSNDVENVFPDYHRKVGETTDGQVLRSFSDPGGVKYQAGTARAAIEDFIGRRSRDLKADTLDVREENAAEGANVLRIRYGQYVNDRPLLGAGIHAVADTERGALMRVDNRLDDDVAAAPDPAAARGVGEVEAAALAPFGDYGSARVESATTAYLRDNQRPAIPDDDYPTATRDLLRTGTAPDGALHLVHDLLVRTTDPFEQFRVVVDAVSGNVLFIELIGKYVAASGLVFLPDPVSDSDSGALSSTSTASTLDALRHPVTLEINPANGGVFRLEGDWIRCVDWDAPAFAVPAENAANFSYQTYPADRRFLSVNAYHWLDTFARYLRTLGNANLNANMTQVEVDAQGFSGADNSQWVPGTPNRIRFGEGGVPDAADFGVIIHEYLHGVFQFQGSDHGGSGSYEHSFCDAIAAVFRDQFNPSRHRRTETFPFDNNATDRWSTERTLNRVERFDDAGFAGYGFNLRNSMLGTAIWESYLGVGGDSGDAGVRQHAADVVIRAFLGMLLNVPDDNSNGIAHAQSLMQGMIDADVALTGGLHSKVFDAAAVARGLWPTRAVDLWIADSAGDSGVIPSPIPHWTSPDLWVRNLGPADGDDPSLGHQEPIVGQPNYLYVNVRNRGTAAAPAGAFTVEAFRCDPGTGMIWPTHFSSMGSLAITAQIPAGGTARVGPFLWTPAVAGHECLLAVVDGAPDPAVTTALLGPVPHDQLVRFDNNVGQRNVNPQMSVPGGKTRASMTMRGGLTDMACSLELDASAMPADTAITVRTLTRIVDAATITGLTTAEHGEVRSTQTMPGGGSAAMAGFPLEAGEAVDVDLVIDFSHEAEHLRTYPLVLTQYQGGQLAGRLSIEIVAVKELEDFVFGNPRSGELHISTCSLWPKLGPGSKIPFVRAEDAIARGYNGCAFCLPAINTG